MDTLLFVFTSDGDDREDASVHYAGYLLVAGNESDRAAVLRSIAQSINGKVNGWGQIMYPYSDEGVDHDALVLQLAMDGWQGRWVEAGMVIREE